MTALNSEGLEKAAERKWTKWSERRPPNASGAFRFRCHCEVLGLLLTPEWTEKMTLCGMGYSDPEWWPLSSCHWDGYRRYITHAGLEWSEAQADDPDGVVWGGLDLSQCPFTGEAAKIKAHGRYIGAPIWHTEAMSVGSSAVPFRRFTDAKKLVEFWNRRALPPVDGLEVVGHVKPDHPEVVDPLFVRELSQPWMDGIFTEPVVTLSQASSVIAGLREKRGAAFRELDEVSSAIGSVRWMDPPDGGSVSLGEQVRRMRDDLEAAEARISYLEEENKRRREALTPSALTKAAYIGEFSIAIERHVNEDQEIDDEAEGASDPYEHVTVPWTTIKEIMAAIRAYAQAEDHNG
jgi:hypothetical protein